MSKWQRLVGLSRFFGAIALVLFAQFVQGYPLKPNALALTSGPKLFFTDSAVAYYLVLLAHQIDDDSCSLSATTLAINLLRIPENKKVDRRETQLEVLETSKSDEWKRMLKPEAPGPHLEMLAGFIKQTVAGYKLNAKVEFQHASAEVQAQNLLRELENFEANALKKVIIINYDQAIFVQQDGPMGHYAVIAGFDESTKQVLILDPDYSVVSPYWVSFADLWTSLTAQDFTHPKKFKRGYIVVRKG